jgi:hypothetical protein
MLKLRIRGVDNGLKQGERTQYFHTSSAAACPLFYRRISLEASSKISGLADQ